MGCTHLNRARVIHLHGKLSSTHKGEDQSCATYFALMKGYVDEMAVVGKRLDDDDIVSYILSGCGVQSYGRFCLRPDRAHNTE
jgi:hypothetical protein